MKTLTEFLAPLLNQLGQKQVRENVAELSGKLVDNQTGQLWSLSEDTAEYTKYRRLLDGTLKTVVDTEKINTSLLNNSIDYFKDKEYIVVLHDGSDLRKPYSEKLENLDTVRDLSGKLITGYPTFNSVAMTLEGKHLRLLQTTPYSTKDKLYLSQGDISDYHAGQLLKARHLEVGSQLLSGNWYNHNTIVEAHAFAINEKIRSVNPDAIIIHVYDRGHDMASLFSYHTENDSFFIARAKLNRNSNELVVNEKGKEVAVKLVKQQFFNGEEKYYEKIRFKKSVYQNARGVFEWSDVEIKGHLYSVVKVRFYDRKGKMIFEHPMLLITNMKVDKQQLAELVFDLYMKRSKIEGVFKFCKQELGWERFRIKGYEGIKNLVSLVYFIAGYFYEIQKELVTHPAAEWLAEVGNGKGKISSHYILKGLSQLYQFLEMLDRLTQCSEAKSFAQQASDTFFLNKNFSFDLADI